MNQQDNNQNEVDANRNNITLTFIKNDPKSNKKITNIQCLPSDVIGNVIESYRTKAEDQQQNLKFIYNAKRLNLSLNVAEQGLLNGSKIFVINLEGLKGGNK